MTYEERERYISNKVGMAYSKQLNEKEQQIIEYLQANTKEVIINVSNISNDLTYKINILKNEVNLDEEELVGVNGGIVSRNYNKKTNELVGKYLSKDIEKLTAPAELFDICDIRKFKNLKELTITNYGVNVNKKLLDTIVNETNIKKINGSFQVDDDVKKDSIVLSEHNSIINYKGIILKDRNFKPQYFSTVYCISPYKDIDKVLNLLDNQDLTYSERLYIFSNKKELKSGKQDIALTFHKAGSYSFEALSKLENDSYVLEFKNVDKIEDILSVIKTLKEHNYKINIIRVNLENKNYDNIYLLKELENEYNFGIKYSNNSSLSTITLNEFVSMRETLNYYKELIQSSNLSPVEQIAYAYDLIKSFKYNEVEEENDKSNSREIHSIIRDGKIVCVGYSVFLAQLLNELGIESYAVSATVPVKNEQGEINNFGHQRNIVNVKDDKYGIDGYYAFDATWDSSRSIVKCVNENREERLELKDKVKPGEKIIKEYNDMLMYRYFLISGSEYQKVFEGEKMPSFEYANHYDNNNSENASKSEISTSFEYNNRVFDKEKLLQIIRTVKMKEGYSEEQIEDIMNEVKEINKIENQNEITQKR